ncbi:MAG: DUF5343 domain-containing protein [Candidatus Limnocylindrales bacterium]
MIDAEVVELDEARRPYAPAANVVAVLERVRRVNLPDVVDSDLLRIAGVSEGAMTRVVYALRFLRLTEPNGRPTDRLRAIAKAPEEEWRDLLAGVVREAYSADFARLDPGQDPQPKIVSAFQRYEPRSQTERMVMLFLGLCRASGIPVLDAPRDRQMQPQKRPVGRGSSRPQSTARPLTARASASSSPSQLEQPVATNVINPNLLFGVTVEDIGALPPDEFDAVWGALGKIARARAQSLRAAQAMADQAKDRQENGEDEEDQ